MRQATLSRATSASTTIPVHQISIISRGGAGGYTMYLPEKDPSYVTKTAMFENIVTLLGGRVAEQLVLEDISTGASSDLQRATDTARAMVTRYGFSERMGPVVYGSDPGETFLGRDFGQGKGYSEAIASEIDNEIRDIVDEAYETARRTLTEHMNELHKVAGVLMEREKISGEEFKTLMEGGTLPPYDLGRGETAQPASTCAGFCRTCAACRTVRNPAACRAGQPPARHARVKSRCNYGSEFFPDGAVPRQLLYRRKSGAVRACRTAEG